MLKGLATSLVLANAIYLAWTHGWLHQFGLLPPPWPQTEPNRMAQQIRPEQIRIIRDPKPQQPPAGPAEPQQPQNNTSAHTSTNTPANPGNDGNATSAPSPTDAPAPTLATAPPAVVTRCLQLASNLNDRQFASLRDVLKGKLADNAWDVSTAVQPARWIVYSGKYASADALATRKAELRQMQVEYRDVSAAALQPGLALGTYSTEAGAQQALKDVTKAGVKGAKVVVERPEATVYTVKLPEATDALRSSFEQAISRLPTDLLRNKTLQPCN